MSLCLSRAVARRQLRFVNPHIVARRNASSAGEAASSTAKSASDMAASAKERLGPTASKASEGLTRVASSSGRFAGKVASALGNTLGGITGRTGRLIGGIQSLIPPTIYYSRVALQLGKIIFEARTMSPPPMQAFQTYFNTALKHLRNPSALRSSASSSAAQIQPSNVLSQIRNVDRQQLAVVGVVAAEVLGFFTVGEMIGRFKLVGYRSAAPAHHD